MVTGLVFVVVGIVKGATSRHSRNRVDASGTVDGIPIWELVVVGETRLRRDEDIVFRARSTVAISRSTML